ncbi:MAG: hypothetical protein HKN07_11020 [Acidimicrobiia bacterium]|nr:hypothetical protein [Acidimicrobiia bacterium]
MTVHIYEMTKVPLKEGIADFRLTEAAGGTDVSIDYEYTPTTTGRLMGPVLKKVLERGLGGLLKGLQMEAEKKASI